MKHEEDMFDNRLSWFQKFFYFIATLYVCSVIKPRAGVVCVLENLIWRSHLRFVSSL